MKNTIRVDLRSPSHRASGWRHLLRERSWKFLRVIVVIAMLANTSSLGAFAPTGVSAATTDRGDMTPLVIAADDASGGGPGESLTTTTGTVWTTVGSCGINALGPKNYAAGDHIYLNGSGFAAQTQYAWNINTLPLSSPIASGTYTTNADGGFCFDAYTIRSNDVGMYQTTFGTKWDTYCITPPVSSITVNKWFNGSGAWSMNNQLANSLGYHWVLDSESPAYPMGQTASNVTFGQHVVAETSVQNYHTVGYFISGTATHTSCNDPIGPWDHFTLNVDKADGYVVNFCNERDYGTVELKKMWSGTPGSTTLKIGTTTGASDIDSQVVSGANGTTGQNTVSTGSYFLTETAVANYSASPLTCYNDVNNNGIKESEPTVAVGTNNAVAVAKAQHVVCSYTNTLEIPTGTVELQKVWSGTPASTTLKIGSTIDASNIDSQVVSGANGTTGQNTVPTGNYFLTETAVANYSASPLTCYNDVNNNGVKESEPTVAVGTNNAVAVANGQHVICSVTNTQQIGTIELKKVWSVAPATTTLKIGTTTGASNIDSQVVSGANGTTGQNSVPTGSYFLTETAVANYSASPLTCYNDVNNNGVLESEPTVAVGADNVVAVANGQHVICSLTNTQQTGTVELKKVWSGAPATTTLKIGTTVDASNIDSQVVSGANGTTGQNTVPTGSYFLNETAVANYSASPLTCYNDVNNNGIKESEPTVAVGTNNAVAVANGQHVICSVTNTQQGGTVTVNKNFDDNGDGQVDRTNPVGWTWDIQNGTQDNVGGSIKTVGMGSITLTEDAVTNYSSAWTCNNETQGTGLSISTTVNVGQALDCTFVNTRHIGTLMVHKQVDTDGNGSFEGDDAVANSLGFAWGLNSATIARAMGSSVVVPNNDYTVSENTKTGYHFVGWAYGSPEDADGNICGGQLQTALPVPVTITNGITSHVTFCNARDNGTVELKKVWSGAPATTTLKIGSTAGASNIDSQVVSGANGTTGQNSVPSGSFFLSEIAVANYTASPLTCYNDVNNNGILESEPTVAVGADNAVAVANGQHVICSLTNTQQIAPVIQTGTVTVNKNYDDNGDGTIDRVNPAGWTWDVVNGSQNNATAAPLTMTTGSLVLTEDSEATYTSAWTCSNQTSGADTSIELTLGNDQAVTCAFTNTKRVTTIAFDKTGPASATRGQEITYTLGWGVAGNTAATSVIITDTLPANTSFVSATNGGTFAAGVVTWNLGTKVPATNGTVSVTVLINPDLTASTTLTNTGTLDTDQNTLLTDTVVTAVTVPQVLGAFAEPALVLTKSINVATANRGDKLEYTLVVTNLGKATATNVIIADTLPDGLTFEVSGKQTHSWSFATLEIGASMTIRYMVVVAADAAAGRYTNHASAVSDEVEAVNAEASVTVQVPQVLGRVLGLATTGAGPMDYLTFVVGFVLVALGITFFLKLRRRNLASA